MIKESELIAGPHRATLNLATRFQSGVDGTNQIYMQSVVSNRTATRVPRPFLLKMNPQGLATGMHETEKDKIDDWPENAAQATILASRSIFDQVWNSPEEDEAWRDL